MSCPVCEEEEEEEENDDETQSLMAITPPPISPERIVTHTLPLSRFTTYRNVCFRRAEAVDLLVNDH